MNEQAIRRECAKILDRMRTLHVKNVVDSDGPVVYISDTYPGVWLEHVYDGIVWAKLTGEAQVAKNYIKLFIAHQRADGQLPCYVWLDTIGYSQIQECVSFGSLCLDAYSLSPDESFLKLAYNSCAKWVSWLEGNRQTTNRGLVETFCGYDTGHDESGRLDGMKYRRQICEDGAALPIGCEVAPMLSPDVNACYYGNLLSLSKMAKILELERESAEWLKKAECVKAKIFELLYDENDDFFYDVDKNGNMRKCKSIAITNVFSEKLLTAEQVGSIFKRYFLNSAHFGTPYPYPSVVASDKTFEKRVNGNSWGYYSQGLTMLRTLRWMEYYGLTDYLHENMKKWLTAWTDSEKPFGQELDPFTGKPSECSPYYSSTMLFYLYSAKELGIFSEFDLG